MTYMSRIQASPAENARQEAQAALQPQRLFEMTPIIHPNNGVPDPASRTFWSAVANAHYIVREDGEDIYGATPGFAAKLRDCPDLVDRGRRGPIGCDADGIAGPDLWRAADRAAQVDRPSAPVAFHAIGWLPTDCNSARWKEMVLEFLDTQIVANGMVVDWAIHALADGDGGWIKRPHVHLVITARFWRKERRQGQPQAAWFPSAKRRTAVGEMWEQVISNT
jgi:hypothetical protein